MSQMLITSHICSGRIRCDCVWDRDVACSSRRTERGACRTQAHTHPVRHPHSAGQASQQARHQLVQGQPGGGVLGIHRCEVELVLADLSCVCVEGGGQAAEQIIKGGARRLGLCSTICCYVGSERLLLLGRGSG